ncbi:MAG: hypothetical protein ABUT20_30180 [Bacteroidota bacterium]
MERKIKIFKSFEEQERYFLEYFAALSPYERLKALSELQKKNYKDFLGPFIKKITIRKHFEDGY